MIDKIIAEVRRLAAEFPENVYGFDDFGAFCEYDKGNNSVCPEKGCIFGVAARNLGLKLDDGTISSFLNLNGEKRVDKIIWCQIVQDLQDLQHCWSKAVNSAGKVPF